MPKQTKQDKLRNLLQLKTDLIDGNTNQFFEDLSELQLSLYPDLKDYLDDFDFENGKFANTPRNRKLVLVDFKKYLNKVLDVKYNADIENYIKSLDAIDEANYGIQKINNISIKPNEFLRKFTVDNVIENLSLDKAVDFGLKPKLQKKLFDYVIGKKSKFESYKDIQGVVKSDDGLSRWSKTIASDALSQYDGQVQKLLVDEFKFDGYYYVGSLIKTSRAQCRHWVDGLNGFIPMDVLAGEVDAWKDSREYDENLKLTVADFAVVRGGYNCRHTATPGFIFKG